MIHLTEPLAYDYMIKALIASGLIGGLCGFLSAYLMLKGWSLIGDALSHAVVPGIVFAHLLALPFAIGAFFTSLIAAGSMLFFSHKTKLKTDAIIGLVFTTFLGVGLLVNSLALIPYRIESIIFGNILTISDQDLWQMLAIAIVGFAILCLLWRSFMLIFFDETHAKSLGLKILIYKVLFFALLSLAIVAALQTVGALLVIALVITPGATAYLLSQRFQVILLFSVILGTLTSLIGVYASYFLDGATAGLIICFQALAFLAAFAFKILFKQGRQNKARSQIHV